MRLNNIKSPLLSLHSNTLTFYILSLLLTIICSIWIFWSGINGDYLFDDWQVLLNSEFINDHSGWWRGYRPLRNLSYLIDIRIGDIRPFTFHLSNLIYHLVNIILINTLIYILVKPENIFDKIIIALIVLIFAIHPVQLESVTYISGRRDILFSFFYIIGTIIFLLLMPKKKITAIFTLLLFTLFSTASKEAGATLPLFAIMLYCHINKNPVSVKFSMSHFKKDISLLAQITAKLKFLSNKIILTAGFILIFAGLIYYLVSMAFPVISLDFMGGSMITHLQNCALFLFKYILILLYPSELPADYSDYSLTFIENPLDIKGLFSLTTAILLTWFSINNVKKRWAAGWLWFAITILPMINIIPHVERFALHYLYLPITGLSVFIWGALNAITTYFSRQRYLKKFHLPACCQLSKYRWSIVVLLLFYIGFLWKRTEAEIVWWQDDIRFWEHTIEIHPLCARAYSNLGSALVMKDRLNEAKTAFQKAIEIKLIPQSYLGLAEIAVSQKQYIDARVALEHIPENHSILEEKRLFVKGMINLGLGDITTAISIAEQLTSQSKGFDGGYFLKGKAAMAQSLFDKALALFKEALLLSPSSRRNQLAYIGALVSSGRHDKALAFLESGFQTGLWKSDDAERLNDMGYIMMISGQESEAESVLVRAITLDSNCIKASLNLSSLYYRQERFKQIIELEDKTFKMKNNNGNKDQLTDEQQDYSRFLNNIALSYIRIGDIKAAKRYLEQALSVWSYNEDALSNITKIDQISNDYKAK